MKLCVPRKPSGISFKWLHRPPTDVPAEGVTWFIDGSLYDEAKRYARRTGFGIVVVSDYGSLLAFGLGIPPEWIVDAGGLNYGLCTWFFP